MFVQTEEKEYIRDVRTMALSNTDVNGLQKYKENKKRMAMIDSLSKDVDSLRSEMSEIKSLLTKLVEK